jgi:predicted NBD/HSP70 family sugar kinase
MMLLTFDIGGTDIKYGILNDDNTFIYKNSIPTNAHLGGPNLISNVVNIANTLKLTYDISGIAISSFGVIDSDSGIVLSATDVIPNFIGLPIKDFVEKETHLSVSVENDVKSMALCELVFGNHHVKNFLTMTVGTGIGGAIIMDSKLYKGHNFSAGEWGHMLIDGSTYESIASISSLVQRSKDMGLDCLNGYDVFEAYDSLNSVAITLVDSFYNMLAIGIANLIYAFNPPLIIIGGGISNRKQRFLDELNHALIQILPSYYFKSCTIKLAHNLNDSGMLGASVHFYNTYKKEIILK